jgi:hypothetical protein
LKLHLPSQKTIFFYIKKQCRVSDMKVWLNGCI